MAELFRRSRDQVADAIRAIVLNQAVTELAKKYSPSEDPWNPWVKRSYGAVNECHR